MRIADLREGVIYHNGKTGPRSFSARKLLNLDLADGTARFEQVAGRYKGTTGIIAIESFASWCKGVVTE